MTYLLLLLLKIMFKNLKRKATILWNRLPDLLRKLHLLKNYSKSQVFFAVSKHLLLEQ